MKNKLGCLATVFLALSCAWAQSGPAVSGKGVGYREAVPGYHYQFPHDHFNHPDYKTEWWYYTGNLKSSDGHRFGFELTFFREAVSRNQPRDSAWSIEDIYVAHLALSDLDAGKFYHVERINRAGPGIAGGSESTGEIWNGNWQVRISGQTQQLQAIDEHFRLQFALKSDKPPVIHGENGVSRKAEGAGHASYYVSFTRLLTSGSIEVQGKRYQVSGTAWMDHEFFTNQLAPDQSGWDWISVQLADNTELMLFRIRRANGSAGTFSAGTYIDARGTPTHLAGKDFLLRPLPETWTSPTTHATYPVRWEIVVPGFGIELQVAALLPTQELSADRQFVPAYWEGAVGLSGTRGDRPIQGMGYLEMTGYDKAVQLGR